MKRKIRLLEEEGNIEWKVPIVPIIEENKEQTPKKRKIEVLEDWPNWKIYVAVGEYEYERIIYKIKKYEKMRWPDYMNYSNNKVAIIFGTNILNQKNKDLEDIIDFINTYCDGDTNKIQQVENLFYRGRY